MSTFRMAYGCLGCLPAQGCCRLRSLGAWALYHWCPDCRKVNNFSPIFLCIFCICAIADDKVCDSYIVSSWALLIFLLCLWWWWPNSNFLCCVITQNEESSRDLLLSVTNRKALAPWGTAPQSPSPPPTHTHHFKTLGYLLTDGLNCLTVKYLAGWHLD